MSSTIHGNAKVGHHWSFESSDEMPSRTVQPSPNHVPASLWGRLVRTLSLASLAVVVLMTAVLWGVSERTWWGTLFTFVPRLPCLIPPSVCLAASCFVRRRSIVTNLIALAIVIGPLMGGRLPLPNANVPRPDGGLTIISCNVQRYEPDFESVLREMTGLDPDVIALQEAPSVNDLLPKYFPGWHVIHESEYCVASRYPLRKLGVCDSGSFQRITAIAVLIMHPDGPLVLEDVHLTTARHGLTKLSWESVVDGTGPARLEEYTQHRLDEAHETQSFVRRVASSVPTVVVGDFNTPTVSNLYRSSWNGFTNAFDQAGIGFGYTAPNAPQRHWFDYLPWLRIDHILVGPGWTVSQCGIGHGYGSDHRLIWALMSRS